MAVLSSRREEYKKYLKSRRWKKIRAIVRKRDRYKCIRCHSQKRLQVHHKSYVNLGGSIRKEIGDCITLCNSCHRKAHGLD